MASILFTVFCFLASLRQCTSLQINNATAATFLQASKACLDAVNAEVACSDLLNMARTDNTFPFESSELTELCTRDCLGELKRHRAKVGQSCSSVQYYDEKTDTSLVPTILDDRILHDYNLVCLKSSSTGQFCQLWFQELRNGTASSDNADCNDCMLGTMQYELGSPFGYRNENVSNVFSSLTSSCGSTGFPLAPATSVIIGTPTTTPTSPTCTGKIYQVKSGDTVNAVAQEQQLSTESILELNSLSSNMIILPTSEQLCLGGFCKTYQVKAGDTCQKIGAQTNITYAQLLSWNGNIGQRCRNIADFIDWSICVSNPRGDQRMPVNTDTPSSMVTTAAPIPTPVGPNTTTNCGRYYRVADNDNCQTISLKFNIPLTDFLFLNPEIDRNCINLWLDTYYCIRAVGTISTYPGYPGAKTTTPIVPDKVTDIPPLSSTELPNKQPIIPTADGTRVDCYEYMWLNASRNNALTDCWALARAYEITQEELVLWNPGLESRSNTSVADYDYPCTIAPSTSYCVALARATTVSAIGLDLPTPRAAGEITNCTNWDLASEEINCPTMLVLYDLEFSNFFRFNPSVKSDCSGMTAGTWYCISTEANGGPPSQTVIDGPTPTVTPTPTNGISTPTPTQDGMIKTCNKFYQVVAGDGCWTIADSMGIMLEQLYAWNPALGSDCAALWPKYYVCVGVPGTAPTSKPLSSTVKSVSSPAKSLSSTAKPASSSMKPVSSSVKSPSSTNKSGPTTKTSSTVKPPSSVKPSTTAKSTAITTPTPFPANMATGCKKFYLVTDGDYCAKIVDAQKITLDNFVKWNPDVGTTTTCSVWLKYHYCVGH